MAISGLGLSFKDSSSTDSSTSVRIHRSTTVGTMYVKFKTLTGPPATGGTQRYVDLWACLETVAKGDSAGGDGFGGWWRQSGATRWWGAKFPVSSFSVTRVTGGYEWSIPLSSLASGSTTLASICQVAFASRAYECVHLHLRAKTWYGDAGSEVASPVTTAEAYVGWIPEYACTGVELNKAGLRVYYSCPGWTRSTDRWELTRLAVNGTSYLKARTWGVVDGLGQLTVPWSALTGTPPDGTATLTVRMNASWREAGSEFASISASGVEIDDELVANTPTLALSVADGVVTATVGDSGDLDSAIESVLVKLAGGDIPSADQAWLAPGESHEFRAAPFGRQRYTAVGYNADGLRGAMVGAWAAVEAPGWWARLAATDGSLAVDLRYDYDLSGSDSPETRTLRLAGRELPTVGYGGGRSPKWTARCRIVEEAVPGMATQSLDDFRALASAGTMVLRLPDGARHLVAVEKVSWEPVDGVPFAYDVAVSMAEVG